MSSGSDSDDNVKMKQFLEAADITLLNNSMFQRNGNNLEQQESAAESKLGTVEDKNKDLLKSQRHLQEYEGKFGTDFNLPESMQQFLAKKLSEILKQQYEFCDVTNNDNFKNVKAKHRNRVKLLKGDECYVNCYEDFEYETKGPEKKPEIKRRNIEVLTEQDSKLEDKLKNIAVDANYILSGHDIDRWAKKKERKDKIFYYRLASSGVSHVLEDINEFSELRRKNKWNENKIKNFKNH